MAQEDRELLHRMAEGDQSALDAFYRLYEGRVFRFIRSKVNDSFEAADVLNEVMFEVWRSAGRFEGRSAVSTWVLGIAHHKAIDRIRRRKPAESVELDPEIAEDDSPNPAETLSAAQNAEQVRHCVDQLSEAHRSVVHLAFFEDLPYGEIASIVGCPEGTVKTRMFHAKKALMKCLAGLKEMGVL
ncbi:sigma-70 family RNA polymerase sigma factor [Pelagibius sp.]|uniref:sigma-70 family RNA polymerase sigma factor n=1 Tax=Pelagibius sp. TaxID=1931238 RepID=UPI0026119D7C|nr:sigma-70 family RNA polymerase sigma factor [Pelagibius sp.]